MKTRVGILVSALVLGIAALAAPTSASSTTHMSPGSPLGPHRGEYRNPVLNHDFPDPGVMQATNGWYYAYGTEAGIDARHVNIQGATSPDLVHWTYLGEVMPQLPAWGNKAVVSWAPEVVYNNGTYYLYDSIVPNRMLRQFGLCLAVATSRFPTGPFVTTDRPLYCGPTRSDIDGDVFKDPKTGQWHVYWGSGGDIVTAPLAANMTQLAAGAQPKLLLRGWSAKIHRPYEHGIEGPFVYERAGWYYLLYSGDNCCSYPPHYATMVARARSATGPFHRLAETRPRLSSVILHSNQRFAGPGHGSVIRDAAGHDWFVHHAIDRRHPYLPYGDNWVRRPMLLERIVYRNGWPHFLHGSPTVGWRPAPVVGR